MSFVCPLPPEKVLIRAEYLYGHRRGHGELVPGIWVSVKALRGQAFRWETYLPEYGAVYDKLPLSAFRWCRWEDAPAFGTPAARCLPLDVLQIWDAMSHHVELVHKPLLSGLRAEFFGKDRELHKGEYMWTLDCCEPDPRIPPFGFSESAEEHKSFNVLRLDNGQYAAQPNNRCRFYDPALTHEKLKTPDFAVCDRIYRVENTAKWRLGDTTTADYDGRTEP